MRVFITNVELNPQPGIDTIVILNIPEDLKKRLKR